MCDLTNELENKKLKKTVHRWFGVWDFDKEEAWLNAMAQDGWALYAVGFCTYEFEKCKKGEYTVWLEMHEFSKEYIEFMEETGAEFCGNIMKWFYFRKKNVLGNYGRIKKAIKQKRLLQKSKK